MKNKKEYFILFPIVIILILSLYGGYRYLEKIQISDNLKNTINKQILLKNVVRSLIKERAVVDSKTIDHNNLFFLRQRTDEDILTLIEENKDDSISSLSSQISTIREHMDDNEKFSNVFFSFYNHINNSIIENYSKFINNTNLDNNLKSYLIAMNLIYSNINNINLDREYIAQAIVNNEYVTKNTLRKWIGNVNFTRFDINFLPSEESKKRIADFIDASESLNILDVLKEEHFEMLESDEEYISKDNLLKIDSLKKDKFLFLLEISNLLESELSIQNKHSIQMFQMYLLLCIVSIFIFATILYKIFKNIQLLERLENVINNMQMQLDPSLRSKTIYDTIKHFTDIYQNLQTSFNYLDEFNNIKNIYLEKIAKRNQHNILNKFQSITFLRQTLTSIEQIKAMSVIEENQSRLSIDFNNIEKIVHFENKNIGVQNSTFDPQEIFKIALESRLEEIREKQINYITFIDPNIKNEVSGDKNKIISIISNIISCAVYQCNQYSKVVVQIKQSDQTSNTDISTIDISIKNNAEFVEKCDINENNMHEVPNIKDEYVSFWLSISNIHLKSIGSKLVMNGSKNTGNEFSFTLLLKTQDNDRPKEISNKKNILIAYINDTDDEYNDCFVKTMNGLNINFNKYQNFKKIANPEQYNIIFARNTKESSSDIKNLANLKDPLTPIKIMQYIQNNINFDSAHKFILNKPQILILESNQVNLNLIKYAFERYNVDITSINEYRNILEIVKKKNFDIVFMDTGLAGVNALDIAKQYKNNEIAKHTPIIAMISNTSHISSQQALDVFDGCIKKPFSKKELNRILTSFIPNINSFFKNDSFYTKSKDILMLKKTSIENKIFSGVLSEFTNNLTVANNIDEFMHDLKNKAYGIALIDDNIKAFDPQRIIATIEESRMKYSTNTKLFIFSNKSQSIFNIKQYAKILSPQISKEQLADIIKQELNANGGGGRLSNAI